MADETDRVAGSRCDCTKALPQPKRPLHPVDYAKHERLECFPCYYDSTWPLEKLPFLKWLLGYKPKWLISDFIAGLTVGMMVVPQALAYARIASLPLEVSTLLPLEVVLVSLSLCMI